MELLLKFYHQYNSNCLFYFKNMDYINIFASTNYEENKKDAL